MVNHVHASTDVNSLRYEAAGADMPFFTAFLNDFDVNLSKYTSYMMQNHITLPQAVADYYYHLAPLATDIDLQSDIAQTFPFTEFQTFVTVFPWYSSLLSDADATTLLLPDDFVTKEVNPTHINSSKPSKSSNTAVETTSSVSRDIGSIRSSSTSPSSIVSTTEPTSVPTTSSSTFISEAVRSSSSSTKAVTTTSNVSSKNDSTSHHSVFPLYMCILLSILSWI